jgi:hypothetical protein
MDDAAGCPLLSRLDGVAVVRTSPGSPAERTGLQGVSRCWSGIVQQRLPAASRLALVGRVRERDEKCEGSPAPSPSLLEPGRIVRACPPLLRPVLNY